MSQYPGDLEENEADHDNNGDPREKVGDDQAGSQPAAGAVGRKRRDVRVFGDHRWLRCGTPARHMCVIARDRVSFLQRDSHMRLSTAELPCIAKSPESEIVMNSAKTCKGPAILSQRAILPHDAIVALVA